VAKSDKRGVRVVFDRERACCYRKACDAPDLAFQVDDQPLGGLLSDAWRSCQGRRVTRRDRARDLRRSCHREDRESGLRANARDADEHLEERELVTGFKSIERLIVFADGVMRMQEHLVARRLPGYMDLVADAVRLDHHVIRTARDHRAADRSDHLSPSGRAEATPPATAVMWSPPRPRRRSARVAHA